MHCGCHWTRKKVSAEGEPDKMGNFLPHGGRKTYWFRRSRMGEKNGRNTVQEKSS